MTNVTFYWTIIVALISAGWAITVLVRDRISQSVERSSALISRLIEYDKLNIDNPDIQQYVSANAGRDVAYFRDPLLLQERLFFKAKTLVYKELNLFDEILSFSARAGWGWWLLTPAPLIEWEDWQEYIQEKLRHPLYRSILLHEQHIFGASLRNFWSNNRGAVEAKPADPFIW